MTHSSPRLALAQCALSLVASLTLALVGCGGKDEAPQPTYRAEIRRTSHGIPHIRAENWGSLGYGMGYAFAEDRACALLDQVIKVRGERARWLGAGNADAHINSDFAYRHLHLIETATEQFPQRPETAQEMIIGYAAGFNAYVEEVGADGLAGHCKGAAWVGPIDEIDLYAYFLDLALLAGSRQLIDAIGSTTPPGTGVAATGTVDMLAAARRGDVGSNGWGIGADKSATGGGMLLANPHFPWEGELRLWESHLTIPGEIDVYGVGLSGVPAVLIGFNEAVAWTHTVSAGHRFNLYLLQVGSTLTSYLYEGEELPLVGETYEIEVKAGDATEPLSRTLYRSHHGPLVSLAPFSWDPQHVLALRDANIDNFVLVDQFLAMDKATSMDEFQAAHRDVSGIPWVNTMSASADGRAWYMDSTPTPNVSAETIAAWEEASSGANIIVSGIWQAASVYVFDGSTARDEWIDAAGARSPGIHSYDQMPKLERSDFIFNANDSHWLTNPAEPLEGYSQLHGFERTARSVRTRMNARILTETGASSMYGADGKLSIDELKEAAVSNRSMVAELLTEELVARCTATPMISVSYAGSTQMVDLTEACQILAGWDLRYDLDSVGAPIMREFNGDFPSSVLTTAGLLFEYAFDVNDPIETPYGLAETTAMNDPILVALGRGVLRLEAAGVPLDAALGEVQHTYKGDLVIPIHGGLEREGVPNKVDYGTFKSTLDPSMDRGEVVNTATNLGSMGYVINNGTSFIMTMTFGPDGPDAWAFLTYSQSEHPSSEYFADQTQLFSDKAWRRCLFREEDIQADPNLESYVVSQ